MTVRETINRLHAQGYEPSEPEHIGHGMYRVTMPGKLTPGTLTLFIEADGSYHAPRMRDRSGLLRRTPQWQN